MITAPHLSEAGFVAAALLEPLEDRVVPAGIVGTVDMDNLDPERGVTLEDGSVEALGTTVAAIGDLAFNGFDDFAVVARSATEATVYVFEGQTSGDIFEEGLAGAFLTVSGLVVDEDHGVTVAAAGDVNGDGLDDMIIGTAAGDAAFVIFGRFSAGAMIDVGSLASSDGFRIIGAVGSQLGASVAGGEDVNGDGRDDIVVGAPLAFGSGRAYVIYGQGSAAAFGSGINVSSLASFPSDQGYTISDTDVAAGFGAAVGVVGDQNGDGVAEVVFVSPTGTSPTDPARVSVLFGITGTLTTSVNLATVTVGQIVSIELGNENVLGASLARGGDFDGDGLEDIVLFSPLTAEGGQVRVFSGDGDLLLDTNGGPTRSITSVAGGGDVNADGLDDIVLGFVGGGVVLFGSPEPATFSLDDLPATAGFLLESDASGAASVALLRDVNSDGFDDLLFGFGEVGSFGKAHLVFGDFLGFAGSLVSARKFTFVDVDGDLVTIAVSKGVLSADMFAIRAEGLGGRLLLVDLNRAVDFVGSDLIITAKRSALGGDGFVNVGVIDAFGIDLRNIRVAGNLDLLRVGDSNFATPGLKSLVVESVGRFRDAIDYAEEISADEPSIAVIGSVGSISVSKQIEAASVFVFGSIGSLNAGSILSNTDRSAVVFSYFKIGTVKVAGDVRGTKERPVVLGAGLANAPSSAKDAEAIKAITVGGDLRFASIRAGSGVLPDDDFGDDRDGGFNIFEDLEGSPINPDARIGSITVRGNWIASSAAAGITAVGSGTDFDEPIEFGRMTDRIGSGGSSTIKSRIGSVAVGGQMLGTDDAGDSFGIVAEEIGMVTLGKRVVKPGASSLVVGETQDVFLRTFEDGTPRAVTRVAGTFGVQAMDIPATTAGLNAGLSVVMEGIPLADALIATLEDINGDNRADLAILTEDLITIVFGPVGGFSGTVDLSALGPDEFATITPEAGSLFGNQLASGDFNRDGLTDLAFVTVAGDGGRDVVVVRGASGFSSVTVGAPEFAGLRIENSDDTTGAFASSVVNAGDFNGDGADDLLIASLPSPDDPRVGFVIFNPDLYNGGGPVDVSNFFFGGLDILRVNNAAGFTVVKAFALGDINADGIDDIALGAPEMTVGALADAGAVFTVFGVRNNFGTSVTTVDSSSSSRVTRIDGTVAGGFFGSSGDGIGDFNGDGIDDFAIGATGQNSVFLFRGSIAFGATAPAAANQFTLSGLGGVVLGVGDFNRDGFDDFALAAPVTGTLAVVFGGSTFAAGPTNPALLSAAQGFVLDDVDTTGFGSGLAAGGDFNNDGFDDFFIAAPTGGAPGSSGQVIGLFSQFQEVVVPFAALSKVTFTDADGDLVTIAVSKGTLDAANLVLARSGQGAVLRSINLTDAEFTNGVVSLTAKAQNVRGDGLVNIGSILAAGNVFSKIIVGGDLEAITVGASPAIKAVGTLAVHSLGLRSSQFSPASFNINGPVDRFVVTRSVENTVGAASRIGVFSVGSILATQNAEVSLNVFGPVGAFSVRGDIAADDESTVGLTIVGPAGPTSAKEAMALNTLTVGGLTRRFVMDVGLNPAIGVGSSSVQVGKLTFNGGLSESQISVGINRGPDGEFGTADDSLHPAAPSGIVSRIASILVRGQTLGLSETQTVIQASQIGLARLGSGLLPLTPAADSFVTGDFLFSLVREVTT